MVPKQKKRNLKFLPAALCLIAALVFSAVFYVTRLRAVLGEEMRAYLLELNRQEVATLQIQFDSDTGVLRGLASMLGQYDALAQPQRLMEIITKENERNAFRHMGYALPDGRAYFTDGTTPDIAGQGYFTRAISGQSTISSWQDEAHGGGHILLTAVPIFKEEEVVGVLIGTHSTDTYKGIMAVKSFGGEGFSYITDQEGEVLIHATHPNSFSEQNVFALLAHARADLGNSFQKMRADMAAGGAGAITYTIKGSHRCLTYAPLGINNWYVLSVVPTAALSEKSGAFIWQTLYLLGAIVLLFAGMVAYIHVTQRRSSALLARTAYTDALTGLKNSAKFSIDAKELLAEGGGPLVLVVFDINNFKMINDLYGYENGNRVLKFIASLLRNALRAGELCARVATDNFALLLRFPGQEALVQRLRAFTSRVNAQALPASTRFNLHISFGIYVVEDASLPVSAMMDRANLARKKYKGHESSYTFYDEQLRQRMVEETLLESEMEAALEGGQFVVYLQPKISLSSGRMAGAEALVRWQHPQKGLIMPDTFIPLFERNHFITRLDMYVLECVCRLQRDWLQAGREPVPIAVNQSRMHLYSAHYIQNLCAIVDKYAVPHALIELELTESIVLSDIDQLREILEELHHQGFPLAMDDFGSGYSSLNLLREIPMDVLKLDREFLDRTSDSRRGRTIVTGIVSIARGLGMRVVSEGVETEQQVGFLADIGCDYAQGFYYSRPIPVAAFVEKYFSDPGQPLRPEG